MKTMTLKNGKFQYTLGKNEITMHCNVDSMNRNEVRCHCLCNKNKRIMLGFTRIERVPM